jgi:hypothetical protein
MNLRARMGKISVPLLLALSLVSCAHTTQPTAYGKVSPALAPNATTVNPTPADLTHLQDLMQSTVKAKVVLITDMLLFRSAVDERMLVNVGCTYSSTDPEQISRLLDILKASARVDSLNPSRRWEQRNGVFLTRADGSVIKILFAQAFRNLDRLEGNIVYNAPFSSIPLSLDKTLQPALYQWAMRSALVQENHHSVHNEECISRNFSGPNEPEPSHAKLPSRDYGEYTYRDPFLHAVNIWDIKMLREIH